MTELDDSVMDIFTKSVSKDGPEASKVCTVSFLQYLAFLFFFPQVLLDRLGLSCSMHPIGIVHFVNMTTLSKLIE